MTLDRTIVLLLAATLLASCQSAPPPISVPTAAHIQQPVPDIADVTYLARDMLRGDKRGASVIYGSLPSSGTSTAIGPGAATAGGIATAAAIGQNPLSPSGAGTAAYAGFGLSVAGALLGGSSDVSHDAISGIVLPREVDGHVLATADDARRFVREDSRRNLQEFAQHTGRTVVCVDQCDSNYPLFELRKNGAAGPTYPFYDPPSLYVGLYIRPLMDADKIINPVRDKAVGFSPAWISSVLNGFAVCLNDKPPTAEKTAENGESVAYFRCDSPMAHPLERDLLRALTASGHYYVGLYRKGIFAWRGRIFALGEKEPATLIKYEIGMATDRPEGK